MSPSTQNIHLFRKGLSLSVTNLWRNKYLSLITAFVIGIIIFIFNIILAVNFIAKDSLENLSRKVDLVLYLKENTAFQDLQNISEELESLPNVEKVLYTSKEDAIKELQTTLPDLSLAFEKYELENPLPASIRVTTPSPEMHQEILQFLHDKNYSIFFSNLDNRSTEENSILFSVNTNLERLHNFTRQILLWIVTTFLIGGALITINALQITIYSRKTEIEVMKLVGASPWFIRFPFLMEGMFYGLAAIIISAILLVILAENSGIQSLSIFNSYSGLDFGIILLGELAFTVILTSLSSLFAVQKHLK